MSIKELVNIFFNSVFGGNKSKTDTLKKEVTTLKTDLIKKTKEENNSKNEFLAIQESISNLKNNKYLSLASENFAKNEYLDIVNYKLPDEMTKMVPNEGPNHLIIEEKAKYENIKNKHSEEIKRKSFIFEEKHPILKGEQHLENCIDEDQKFLIEGTKTLWEWLRIGEEINEQNKDDFFENFNKDLEDLKELDFDILQFFSPFFKDYNNKSYKELIQLIYESYTENAFELINKVTSTKDPVVMLKIKYLIQFLLYNHRMTIYGDKIDPKKPLYRMITIKKELNVLYKKNSAIFFTSPTLVSSSEQKPKVCPNDKVLIKFRFKLLSLSKQEGLKFYSGILLQNNDILVMPYQIFMIENVERKTDRSTNITFYVVTLNEIENKLLIEKLEEKIGRKVIKDEDRLKYDKKEIIKELEQLSLEKEKEIQKIEEAKEILVEKVKDKINEIMFEKREEHKESMKLDNENIFDFIINANADENLFENFEKEVNLEEIKEKESFEQKEEEKEIDGLIEKKIRNLIYKKYTLTLEEKMVADPNNFFRRITIEKNKDFIDFDFLSILLEKAYKNASEIPKFFMNYLLKMNVKENEGSNFVFDGDHFSKEGNYNYTYANFFEERRGGLVYNFPNGWKRIGLNVNLFNNPNKDWIDMSNTKGEYANLFCFVKNQVIDHSVYDSDNNNHFSNNQYKKIKSNGVQGSSNVNFLKKFIEKVEIAGHQFLIALQCRAPNFDIQFNSTKKEVYVIEREEVIRPYGILIKKVEE